LSIAGMFAAFPAIIHVIDTIMNRIKEEYGDFHFKTIKRFIIIGFWYNINGCHIK